MVGLLADWNRKSKPIVAVIDDDDTERYLLSEQLDRWGYKAEVFEGQYDAISVLIAEIAARGSDFVICDNHLQQAGYARFFGAEVVSELLRSGIPSILVTQHQDTDNLRLKKWRVDLPVILDKSDIDEQKVAMALNKCAAEVVDSIVAPDRRPYRVLIEVDSIRENEVVAFVDAWNPHESVSFPVGLLGEIQHDVLDNSFLLADVNIGASHWRELFFTNFEIAPEPDPDDGLV